MGRKILRVVRRTFWIAFLAAAWLSLVGGVVLVVEGFADAPKIEAAARCTQVRVDRCIVEQTGVVTSSDGSYVHVRYDDGRRTSEVTLLAEQGPPVGKRVRLQRWNGDVVAVYDPAFERRYRTMEWPRRWDPYGIGAVLFGAGVIAFQLARRFAFTSRRRPPPVRASARTPVAPRGTG